MEIIRIISNNFWKAGERFSLYIRKHFGRDEEKIKYFLKLPHWFKIPTPFGNYNPDWAILAEKKDSECLYFIADTKSTTDRTKLRNDENARIEAGKRAYEAKGMENIIFKAPIVVVGNLDL